ncbi:MAG: protein phosphatase CheZ [Pseudomonadota bacterium]|nr:protein phosphatase CheZ [Pseudomonadota bacterium]
MSDSNQLLASDDSMTALLDTARGLVEKIESGHLSETAQFVADIVSQRDRKLYEEVGKLTRALHSALNDFHIDTHLSGAGTDLNQISDASDRLNYVIRMTDDAANRTMDEVEASIPIACDLRSDCAQLNADWKRFARREMTPDEFRALYRRMDEFLDRTQDRANGLESSLNSILMAQGYQDLTGQVIKKVIELVQQVEQSLVSLVRMAGEVERLTGVATEAPPSMPSTNSASAPAGPNVHGAANVDVVSDQDEVDELLSSLGF